MIENFQKQPFEGALPNKVAGLKASTLLDDFWMFQSDFMLNLPAVGI